MISKLKFDGIKIQFWNGIGFGLYRHNEMVIGVDEDTEEAFVMPVESITLHLPLCRIMLWSQITEDTD